MELEVNYLDFAAAEESSKVEPTQALRELATFELALVGGGAISPSFL